jgi:hypothetical protein
MENLPELQAAPETWQVTDYLADVQKMLKHALENDKFKGSETLSDGITEVAVSSTTSDDPIAKCLITSEIGCSPKEVVEFLSTPSCWMDNKLDANLTSFSTKAEKKEGNVHYKLNLGEWSPGWPIWNR